MTFPSYSSRLGRISPEQFQKALEHFRLGEFIKAEPIPYGLFGQNVFLTGSKGDFVLRGAPHYPWQFPIQPTVVLGDYGEHNLVVNQRDNHWRVSGVFDMMTAHFGDGAADLCGPIMGYLKEDESYADAFLKEYLSYKPVPNSFVALQRLYMLDLCLSIWRYFQKHQGGLPEDKTKKWTFEKWAKPFIEYWKK